MFCPSVKKRSEAASVAGLLLLAPLLLPLLAATGQDRFLQTELRSAIARFLEWHKKSYGINANASSFSTESFCR
eukprot:10063727-Alexandrium_andersonii.AAC.1